MRWRTGVGKAEGGFPGVLRRFATTEMRCGCTSLRMLRIGFLSFSMHSQSAFDKIPLRRSSGKLFQQRPSDLLVVVVVKHRFERAKRDSRAPHQAACLVWENGLAVGVG